MISVIVGPPCSGKSTFCVDHAASGDVIVDFDKLAVALGSTVSHATSSDIKEAAFAARDAVIGHVLKGIEADAWIIHTSPTAAQLKTYVDAGALFTLLDPGKDACIERAVADERPELTMKGIESWYESPPEIPECSTPPASPKAGFLMPEEGRCMKFKNAEIKIKAGPDDGLTEGQFTAYASTFTPTPDSYGDVVLKGAFAGTLTKWDESGNTMPLLWGHDMSDPYSNIGEITKAEEDDRGLLITAQLDLDSPKAAQVYRLLKGRRVSQMSFSYDVIEAEKNDHGGLNLKQVNIHEASVVPIGANPDTEILTVKAATASLIAGVKAGSGLSAENEAEITAVADELSTAADRLKELLSADPGEEGNDQDEASASDPAKSDEEPAGAKSDEGSGSKSPVDRLAAMTKIYALKGAERGSK